MKNNERLLKALREHNKGKGKPVTILTPADASKLFKKAGIVSRGTKATRHRGTK